MAPKKSGIGRGLDALFLETFEDEKKPGGVEKLKTSLIDPKNGQPRKKEYNSTTEKLKDEKLSKRAENRNNKRQIQLLEEAQETEDMKSTLDEFMPDSLDIYDRMIINKYLKQKAEHEKQALNKIFGHSFFDNEDLTFEPAMNIATPQNYLLGPGDAVFIDIYGASQGTIQETISPDGYVVVEDYGPIQLAGLTVEQANARLRSQLGSRYNSSNIKLTVGQTRTITVNIIGEVRTPGAVGFCHRVQRPLHGRRSDGHWYAARHQGVSQQPTGGYCRCLRLPAERQAGQ